MDRARSRRAGCALALLLAGPTVAACYHGAPADADVAQAWRGRSRAELEDRWGARQDEAPVSGATVLHWSHTHQHVELPGGSASLSITPGRVEAHAAVQLGELWKSTTDVVAAIDPAGTVADVRGPTTEWGAPNDANLRWGVIFGAHAGLARLDDTPSPRAGGGAYIGGMIGPRLALLGAFSLASGSSSSGGGLGLAGSFDAQWWPATRLDLRAGPAFVIDLPPGNESALLRPGVNLGAGAAIVKVGRFVVDLRLDAVIAPSLAFGSLGVGVNLD